jgi:hypothetical protein
LVTGVTAAVAGLLGASGTAHGDGVDAQKQALNERCAIRTAGAILGQSPAPALMTAADPQAAVDGLLTKPEFIERFARFVNAASNRTPAAPERPGEDAAYFLSKYVLENGKPWSDVYLGQYTVEADGQVKVDPNGLGYFRSPTWMAVNSGAEPSGLRLATANRIMQNVVGFKLTASTNAPNSTPEERSAAGRQRAECAGCHYDTWFALDKIANILSRRKGGGATPMTWFDPPEGYAPQQALDGTISNDKDVVTRLVASENFSVNACRRAFEFLYGRDENTCDGELFDKCVDEFKAKKTIQSAVAVIAKHASFCQ